MRDVSACWMLAAACAAIGCSGSEPGAADAAPPDGASDGGLGASAPDIPWLAQGAPPIALVPCPSGWRELPPADADGVATCDPYPASGTMACPPGQGHFLGEPGCVPVGNACPTGDWPAGLAVTGVRYVHAGAPTGGDGSVGAPYARIADALAGAPVGTTVALAKGRYDEVVSPGPGVTIIGACAEATVVAPRSLGTARAAVNVGRVGHVTIRDLSVADSPGWGVRALGVGVELEIDGVEVRSATAGGVVVSPGAHFVAHSLVVRDTRPDATGAHGRGLDAAAGTTAQVSRAIFERNSEVGVIGVGADTRVELTDVVVRDTQAQRSDGANGFGVYALGGATVQLMRALFERNHEAGLFVRQASTLSAADVIVRDTESRPADGTLGLGLGAGEGATVQLTRALFERNRQFELYVADVGTTARLADMVVRSTREQQSDGSFGRGLDVQSGAAAEVDRALFEHTRQVAIVAFDPGTTLRLTDVVVRDTESRTGDGAFGRAVDAASGAHVEVLRALFERNREVGLLAVGDSSSLQLTDVVVRGTRRPACADTMCGTPLSIAIGMGAYELGALGARRFDVDGSDLCGVQVALEGELDLHDGVVRRSMIGACVQRDGYDLLRLLDRVTFVDNAVGLEATMLPVPNPALPFGVR